MPTMCEAATVPATLTDEVRAFHGTTPDAAKAILRDGFHTSAARNVLGPGTYLCRDADDAALWAARTAVCDQLSAGVRYGDVDWDAPQRCSVVDVTIAAGVRHVTLTVQRTAWGEFTWIGDANGTLAERYSSDAETRELGMCTLGPILVERYAAEHGLDVIEVALDRPHDWFRTSQLVVLPHALDAVTVHGVRNLHATCGW